MKLFLAFFCVAALALALHSCEPLDSGMGNADQEPPDTTSYAQDTAAPVKPRRNPRRKRSRI